MKKQSRWTLGKKLVLNRETLRQLDAERDGYLKQVAGGTGSLCEDTCITSHNLACTTKP